MRTRNLVQVQEDDREEDKEKGGVRPLFLSPKRLAHRVLLVQPASALEVLVSALLKNAALVDDYDGDCASNG